MSDVKIVLLRNPRDPKNGVWVDGVKLDGVQEIEVFGSAREFPHVIVKLLPTSVELGVENPDIDKV